MRRTDIQAIGELGGEALAAGGALVQDMHEGIAARPFGVLGAAAAPVRVAHDGVANLVYASVRGGLRAAALAGGALAGTRATDDGPALVSTPRGALALGALNGLYDAR